MTHIVGLRLTNWRCFRGEHELDLNQGIYSVVAAQNGDDERSNYLGKSSLLLAIRYALEGYKPADVSSLDQLISDGEPEMGVDVELSDGTFVSRTKKRGASTVIRTIRVSPDVGEIEMFGPHAESEVWKSIGLTADDLETTAYAEQKQLARLVSPSSKIDLGATVNTWLELDRLEQAGDAAGEELRKMSSKLFGIETLLANEPETKVEPFDRELAHRALEKQIAELEIALSDYSSERAQRDRQAKALADWQTTRQARIVLIVSVVEAMALRVGIHRAPSAEQGQQLSKRCEETSQALARARDEASRKKQLAAGLFDGTCPVNGCACPIQTEINVDRKKNQKLYDTAKSAADDAFEADRAATVKLREWRDEQEKHNRSAARAAAAVARIHVPTGEKLLANPMTPAPTVASDEVASPEDVLLEARRKLIASKEMAAWIARNEREARELKAHVAAARAGFAVLGPEGAQRRCAERAVQQIERVANADLRKAGIDLSVQFRWGRETQIPAVQCAQCGAPFPKSAAVKRCESCSAPRGMKIDPKPRFVLSRVSGAAEDLVGLAVRCSAFQWLKARRGASWSVAVLDEPFGALDRYHRRALASHVQGLLASTFDQAFVVAHDRQVLDSMPQRIEITSDGRWSKASVAS